MRATPSSWLRAAEVGMAPGTRAAFDPLRTARHHTIITAMVGFMNYLIRTAKITAALYAGISIVLIYLVARYGVTVLKDAAVTVTFWIVPIASAIIAIGSDKSEQG